MSLEQTEPTPDAESMLSASLACAAAADAYVAADRWYAPGPVLLLLVRGLELALKGYAVHEGASADTLRYQLGAELEINLRHALDRGLVIDGGLSAQDRSTVRRLGGFLRSIRTEYPDVAGVDLPATSDVRLVVGRLMVACVRTIRGEEAGRGSAAEMRGLLTGTGAAYRVAEPAAPPRIRSPAGEQSD